MGLPKQIVQQLLKENAGLECKQSGDICVKIVAITDHPTVHGEFQLVGFENNLDGKEHAALVRGDVYEKEDVPVRLHSECLTGDALGSLRCDCQAQLQSSLRSIGQMECGVILYMRQEGRGIGLTNKIRAMQLQELGYDTFQANELLGYRRDERDYQLGALMLRSLHVRSIKLMTNNPDKIRDLESHGIKINDRIPVITNSNKHDEFYLISKKLKAGHLLDGAFTDSERQAETVR